MRNLVGTERSTVTGERRPVTALFADVVGSTALAGSMDPEDWVALIDPVLEAMSVAIRRFDGTITSFAGDAVVAFFGAPEAHEDDPARAVLAGLDLVAAVSEIGTVGDRAGEGDLSRIEVRVGINTGLAVVGEVGGQTRTEYTAMGDAVNVAARIQAAARPGTVWMAASTHQLVQGRFEVIDVGPIAAKGKDDPIQVYEVVRALAPATTRGIAGLTSPLVGRDAELAALQHALAVTVGGRGRLALLMGEPGIGKSRLVEELRSRTTAGPGPRWVTVRCPSHGAELAHHLVSELITGTLGAADRQEVPARLAALLGADDEGVGFLCHLLGVDVPATTAVRLQELDRAALHAYYRDGLTALLRGLEGPHVVVVEDAHWADPSSVELLTNVLEVLHELPILLVCTTRPDRDSHGWRLVQAARELLGDALVELRLEPLSDEQAGSLMGHLLAIESLPPDIRRTVLERTEGNPLFLEEIVRSLIEQGSIEQRDGRWIATGTGPDPKIPETVHSLLLSRIDRVAPAPRRALRVAAVLGREFDPDVLAEVVPAEAEATLRHDLGVLEWHGLVRPEPGADGLAYAFRHALVQEAAYASLLRRERQELHGRVADVLLTRAGDAVDDVARIVAHHLEEAGATDRAVDLLLVAAQTALDRFAPREAFDAFARAAGHLSASANDQGALRRRVVADLGQVEAGRTFVPWDRLLVILDRLLPAAERLGDRELLVRAHLAAVDTRATLGELPGTSPAMRTSLERALELADALDNEYYRALPLAYVGLGKLGSGDLREAAKILSEVSPVFERQERLAKASFFASFAADAFARLGDFPEAEGWAEHALALGHESGDPNAILDAELALGGLHAERGNLQEALEFTRRAVERADQVGNTLCALVGNFMIGDQRLRLGQAEAAVPALERSGELAEYCDAGTFAALSEAWLASARAQLGGHEPAWDEFDRALATARANGDRLGEAEVLHHRARIASTTSQRDPAAVEADFEAAIARFEQIGALPYLARTLQDQGIARELAGDSEGARTSLTRAQQLFEQLDIL